MTKQPCEFCKGKGYNKAPYDDQVFNCPHCNGRGMRVVEVEPKPIELKNESWRYRNGKGI